MSEITDRTNDLLRDFGYPDLSGHFTSDGTFLIDGAPDRVKACADELVATGKASLVGYENGNDLDDPDYHGWGHAAIKVGL